MAKLKQVGMAAGTFSVALGIGFVMQNGDALASRFGTETAPPEPAPFTADGAEEMSLEVPVAPIEEPVVALAAEPQVTEPVQEQTVAIAAEPEIEEPIDVVASAVVLPSAVQVPTEQEAPVQLANLDAEILPNVETDIAVDPLDCSPSMEGLAGSGAMVKVVVNAPCHADTAFVTHHQGMMFSAMTNDAGMATFTVPALAEVSVIITAFANGDGAVATTVVPDFADYDRAVLQWQGDEAVMLSAYEGAAEFGDSGHIYNQNPGDMARLDQAEGGYLMQLGDASVEGALMAEVYTFPTGATNTMETVMLVAEAEITNDNCGQELNAQSIQVSPSGETAALDLVMTMPDCEAVGDVLILQNMFEDLTLASR